MIVGDSFATGMLGYVRLHLASRLVRTWMNSRQAILWLVGLFAGAVASCAPPAQEMREPRLVLLYATCTLNKDFLAPYDAGVNYTPNIQRFADEAIVFERHVTEAGVSGTAYASILSGTQADRHGVYSHPHVLADELYLITEAFADDGYETFFWNAHRMASPELNYAQGVPEANAYTSHAFKKRMLTEEDPRFVEILRKLDADPEYRAFIVVNFTVTHAAYSRQIQRAQLESYLRDFPEHSAGVTLEEVDRFIPLYEEHRLPLQWNFPHQSAELELSDADTETLLRVLSTYYKATVHELDRLFGRTMEALDTSGWSDRALVAFTADHGEMLYRDNALFYWGHGLQLVPEVLNVPWLLRVPDLPAGRYSGVTRSIDVFPTLAGLAGVDIPEDAGVVGEDVSPALVEGRAPPSLLAYSHTKVLGSRLLEEFHGWQHVGRYYPRDDPNLMWVAVRDGDMSYKLRHLGDERWGMEVYDLGYDPEERHDLFDPESAEHDAMRALLEGRRQALIAAYDAESQSQGQSPEEIEAGLRALGYIGED